jgi:hypothetical protein
MFRTALATAAVFVAASIATGCDDGNGTETDRDTDIVVPGDQRPFDPRVPEGVDTPTDEVRGQGFDPETPGPEGMPTPLPD